MMYQLCIQYSQYAYRAVSACFVVPILQRQIIVCCIATALYFCFSRGFKLQAAAAGLRQILHKRIHDTITQPDFVVLLLLLQQQTRITTTEYSSGTMQMHRVCILASIVAIYSSYLVVCKPTSTLIVPRQYTTSTTTSQYAQGPPLAHAQKRLSQR